MAPHIRSHRATERRVYASGKGVTSAVVINMCPNVLFVILHSHHVTVILSLYRTFYLVSLSKMYTFIVLDLTGI